ncbi:hypothetical protein B0H13DRAFT_1882093 [Mycena leptocephala]|nr:hypothetical protein B0H13DRAFT_1882093 [Mycena leptocephala]
MEASNSAKLLNNWPLLVGLAEVMVPPHPLPGPQHTLHNGGAYIWNLRTSAILTLCVYALFNCNRVILGLLSLAGFGSLAIGMWLGNTADATAPLPRSSCIISHVSHCRRIGGRMDLFIFGGVIRDETESRILMNESLIVAVDVANILMHHFGDPLLAGSFAWLASALSAVLIARLMLNMHEVADTDGMTIGEVASEESLSVEWNTIDDDSIPMEQMGGHMWNRASWGHGSHLE